MRLRTTNKENETRRTTAAVEVPHQLPPVNPDLKTLNYVPRCEVNSKDLRAITTTSL